MPRLATYSSWTPSHPPFWTGLHPRGHRRVTNLHSVECHRRVAVAAHAALAPFAARTRPTAPPSSHAPPPRRTRASAPSDPLSTPLAHLPPAHADALSLFEAHATGTATPTLATAPHTYRPAHGSEAYGERTVRRRVDDSTAPGGLTQANDAPRSPRRAPATVNAGFQAIRKRISERGAAADTKRA